MSKRTIVLTILCCTGSLFTAPSARADLSAVDGSKLLANCQAAIKLTSVSPRLTRAEDDASTQCIAYVQGVLDANMFWHAIDLRDGKTKTPHYCMEKKVTFEQAIRVLVKYLKETPTDLSENGFICIQAAMLKSFPCQH
jgi:hypothetical protein